MAIVTITEASKMCKCGRATIYRKLNSGEMSGVELPDGGRGVDTSELIRVFGEIRSADAEAIRRETDTGRDLIRENEHLRELLSVKDEHIETLKQAMRLLEDKRTSVEPDQADQVAQVEALTTKAADLEKKLNQAKYEASELSRVLEAERSKGFFARLFKK